MVESVIYNWFKCFFTEEIVMDFVPETTENFLFFM
jgi:hypothetical protein